VILWERRHRGESGVGMEMEIRGRTERLRLRQGYGGQGRVTEKLWVWSTVMMMQRCGVYERDIDMAAEYASTYSEVRCVLAL